jgi:hypothetical protein
VGIAHYRAQEDKQASKHAQRQSVSPDLIDANAGKVLYGRVYPIVNSVHLDERADAAKHGRGDAVDADDVAERGDVAEQREGHASHLPTHFAGHAASIPSPYFSRRPTPLLHDA